MSQKVQIVSVKVEGSKIYLGNDKYGNPLYTRNPDKVMNWLCDGWRFYFNYLRQFRPSSKLVDGEWVPTTLGGDRTPEKKEGFGELKKRFFFLESIPSRVIDCRQLEASEWNAAWKRKENNGGALPSFRSRNQDQIFTAYYIGGKCAVYHKLSKSVGEVIIGGVNQNTRKQGNNPLRFKIIIRVNIHQDIEPYTSVKVNWTQKTLSFTNQKYNITKDEEGTPVGMDRGVTKTIALSDGTVYHSPKISEDELKKLQRKLARQVKGSKNWEKTKAKISKFHKKSTNIKDTWAHQVSSEIVKNHSYIAMEDLKIQNMTKSAKGTVEEPGTNVKAKSGLNHAILNQVWGKTGEYITYKGNAVGVPVVKVPAPYTSQKCSECGYVSKDNRQTQASFVCQECGHTENADINAAKNILTASYNLC